MPAPGVDDPHVAAVVDELEQVAIAGDDIDGSAPVAASVPMTSSASCSGAPTTGMPSASRASRMIGTCTLERSGTTSTSGPAATTSATRWALYDGIRSTRHCGRQSSSQQATSSRRLELADEPGDRCRACRGRR